MLSTNHNLLFKATILALCIISFVHIFLFPLYDINAAGRKVTKTYMDFEQYLCTTNIKHKKPLKRTRCPQYGIVTAIQGGRLGNQMWEYASVWALARHTGLEPYIPRCIRLRLDQVFESLSVPTFEEIAHCPVDPDHLVKSHQAWNYTYQSIILPRYTIQADLVITWVQDIVQEFSIKKKLLDKSQQILFIASKNTTNRIFVGVHVRRTDYLHYVQEKYHVPPASVKFYWSAMEYFESKYQDPIFVVVSDDPEWCVRRLNHRPGLNVKPPNVYFTSTAQRNSPALDLAILASCNHSIIDYGTYGQWAAILAGGETVYYNLPNHSTERLGQLLSNWHTIQSGLSE